MKIRFTLLKISKILGQVVGYRSLTPLISLKVEALEIVD